MTALPGPGIYVPQCDEQGEYKPLQYHSSIGHSWCVDRDGTEIEGTRALPGDPAPICPTFTSALAIIRSNIFPGAMRNIGAAAGL